MAVTNFEVADSLHELADLLEIDGGDRFRQLAYRRAGDAVKGLARDVASMSEAELISVHGIGRATAGKIRELVSTGSMEALQKLRAKYPPGVLEMTRLAGLGPKKAVALHEALGIGGLAELALACREGRLRDVKGFGPRSEENLLRALATHSREERRVLLGEALAVAEEMLDGLRSIAAVERASYAGSLRRMRDTIGDLDLLAASTAPAEVVEAFVALPMAGRVQARGPTKTSLMTRQGLAVDLRIVAPDEFGSALQYFTGSKAHNVKVREHAVRQGLKLSEYGLFRGAERLASATEEEVYAAVGMQAPPAPMREDRGEVELALRHALPRLVEVGDLRGDLQSHSLYSDGTRTIREMALAAVAKGYEYFAVTDHGANLPVVHNLSLADIARQRTEIAELNRELAGRLVVLHGLEANIGIEGELDYPDEVLAGFDIVVASLHSQLRGERAASTRRVLRAIANPHVHVLGHPTGRMLGRRPGADLDMEAVCRAALAHGVALEINANPRRLDLRDDHAFLARQMGCLVAISTDAHAPRELDLMRFGVATAQRGWVEPSGVINTWPLERLRRFVAKEAVAG